MSAGTSLSHAVRGALTSSRGASGEKTAPLGFQGNHAPQRRAPAPFASTPVRSEGCALSLQSLALMRATRAPTRGWSLAAPARSRDLDKLRCDVPVVRDVVAICANRSVRWKSGFRPVFFPAAPRRWKRRGGQKARGQVEHYRPLSPADSTLDNPMADGRRAPCASCRATRSYSRRPTRPR